MFIVYHKESTVKMKQFETETAAKRSVTCMNRNARNTAPKNTFNYGVSKEDYAPYAYTDAEDYSKNVVYNKKVINLMTRKEIEIPSNTPACCDPSTETYWSM